MEKRLAHLDLARGIAVLSMFFVHVLHVLAEKPVRKTFFGQLVEFLGGAPAAPTFMFLMGMGVVWSARAPGQQAMRGLKLLALGYALNFFRASLPTLAGLPYPADPWESFWMVDIFQLAGLSLLLLSWLSLSSPWLLATSAVAIGTCAPLLWGLGGPAFWPLWGKHWNVFFPFFPWAAFVLAGMAFARAKLSARWVLAIGGLLVLGGVPLHKLIYDNEFFTYYRATPGAVLWMTGFVLLWLELWRRAALRWNKGMLFNYLAFWSRNVTSAYGISWLLIMWMTGITGYRTLGPWGAALMMFVVMRFTGRGVKIWSAIKPKKNSLLSI